MTGWAWASAGMAVLTLTLAAHPFVSFPLSLRVLARLRPRPLAGGPVPSRVAVCVCAYNEQDVIASAAKVTLASLNTTISASVNATSRFMPAVFP